VAEPTIGWMSNTRGFRVLELDERVSDVAGTQNILTGGTQDIRCVFRRVSRTGDRLHAFDNLLAVLDNGPCLRAKGTAIQL
jgi:hypothetical protein